MKKKNNQLQSAKVAAGNTLKTRVIRDKKKYTRKEKHKKAYKSDDYKPFFYLINIYLPLILLF